MTDPTSDRFDEAVARRLAKLSTMPVDTGKLDRALNASGIGLSTDVPARGWAGTLRPLLAIAATLLFIAVVGIAFLQGRPARANALMQLHRDLITGKVTTVHVASMDDVNKTFTAFACGAPTISASGDLQPNSCCVSRVDSKDVPCVMLTCNAVPVTLVLTVPGDVRLPAGSVLTRHGETFHAAAEGTLNLVVTDRGKRTICVVGALSTDQLITLADDVKFSEP